MGYNFKKLTDEEIAQSVKSEDKILINIDGKICQATVEQIVNASSLKTTVNNMKNDLMGSGSQYFDSWKNGSATVAANTIIQSFRCLKSGIYVFCPHFRFALPLDKIFSVMLSEDESLPYQVNVYPNAITSMGTGGTNVVSGVQFYNLKANTKYYVIGYANYGIKIEQVGAYNIYAIKTE